MKTSHKFFVSLQTITSKITASKPLLFATYLALSWLFAVCSQIIIPLPFNLVPISLQPMPLLLTALLFGRHAVYAYGLYLMQGAAGLPFFAGMQGGLVRIFGPTGGYLIGFAFAMMFLASVRSYKATSYGWTIAKLLGSVFIYFSMGLTQLAWFVPVEKVLACGLFPFLMGDAIKILLVAGIVQASARSPRA